MYRFGNWQFALCTLFVTLVTVLVWPKQEPPSALLIQIDTPLEVGSELFLAELFVTEDIDGKVRTTLLANGLVRADRITDFQLPKPCCAEGSQLALKISHPGYQLSEVHLGALEALDTDHSVELTPVPLVDWLSTRSTVDFMQVQAHLDRSDHYLSVLAANDVATEAAVEPQLTRAGLRAFMSSARFQSATEKGWRPSVRDQKMMALRHEFEGFQLKLFGSFVSSGDRALEMSAPKPFGG